MRISFVIPTFNCPWLASAVDSCLNQTHKDVEIVVVDDNSTDNTIDYIDWLKKEHPEVAVLKNTSGKGRSSARNLGNKWATGNVICVLDSDDYAHPDRAKKTSEKMEKGFDFVYGSAEVMSSLGKSHGVLQADTWDKTKAIESLENRIVHSTCAYTKEISKRFPYRTGKISELGIDDWAFQTEVFLSGCKIDFIPSVVTAYRSLQTGVSRTRDAEEVRKEKLKFLEELKVTA